MKAFLSHSSKDKWYVEAVAERVGGANVELDSKSFEYGLTNTQAIISALERCELFVLFVSKNSSSSEIVKFEARVAEDLHARGLIDRLLYICLDSESFESAPPDWKRYNFVRCEPSAKVAARLIQSTMMAIRARRSDVQQPFVGRASELNNAKERIIDPSLPQPTAVFVSGNNGIGRRTFVRQLYNELYPAVSKIIPEIAIDSYDSFDELYRKLWAHIEPETTIGAFLDAVKIFSALNDEEKSLKIAQLIGNVQSSREAIIFRDHGGLMQESGALQPAVQSSIGQLSAYPHPAAIFVAERTPPAAERALNDKVLYCPLSSLSESSVRQLIAIKLRQIPVNYSEEQLGELVSLSDRHPFNVNYIMECVAAYGLDAFIADPSALTTWKNRRTSEFIESLRTDPNEARVLSILRHFPALDFAVLVEATGLPVDEVGNAVSSLIDKHIVEIGSGSYFVSPPVKGAVDRSAKFRLAEEELKHAMRIIGAALVALDEGSTVPVSLVESGILAMLHTETELPAHVEAFLLPSHLIWLARRRYDEREFGECIKLAQEALKSRARLSMPGKVEACRLLCLSAARLNRTDEAKEGMEILLSLPKDPWVQTMVEFLKGFEARLDGRLPEAEAHQREAFRYRPGNFHAARELAFICLTRGNVADAEFFARKAFEIAPDNPYILDILASVLIKTVKSNGRNVVEIDDLLERLRVSSRDQGKTFYETRAAEYALYKGDKSSAARIIDEAVKKTPGIFDVRAVRARIYTAIGNRAVVSEEISKMNGLVQRSAKEGRTNLRPLIEIRSDYYVLGGDFESARGLYAINGIFDDHEKAEALKRIDTAQAYARQLRSK